MSDLISRQAAISIPLMPKGFRKYQTCNLDDAYDEGWMDCQACISQLPSAEAEPVKRGRWKMSNCFGDGFWVCSECNELWTEWRANVVPIERMNKTMRYCPHCGAKMGEKEE